MRDWEPAFALDAAVETPLFLQIARAITDDVRRGRLRPGDRLPGSRSLAEALRVHRNTVVAAYRELGAEGWVSTRPAGATLVSTALPEASPRTFSRAAGARTEVPPRVGFELGAPLERHTPLAAPRGTLALASGLPDLRLVPVVALARAYRRALRTHGSDVLSYGDARGHSRLRVALAAMLSALRGLAATDDSILVTRGSQMALDLVARVLISPGDVVAVEALGYPPAWLALRAAGARLVPIPVDEQGLDVHALRALLAHERVRAVYVTPHHQYPTTVGMSAGRRLALLALAREQRVAILEDDYDYEFHYEGRPVLPLASADRAGVVVYIGTLSKILAPGLRIGFVVAPAPMIERLAALRTIVDRQGDHAVECAVAELLEDGEVQRHARRVRRIYRARRDVLVDALRTRLGETVDVTPAAGGMALWVRAPGIDVETWATRALAAKVAFSTGRRFAFDGRARAAMRLGFASLTEDELREAVRRMSVTLTAQVRSPPVAARQAAKRSDRQ